MSEESDKPMATQADSSTRVPTENAPRDCGSCNVCCTAMHVRPLNKPSGQRCSHQSTEGCGIYHDRPSVCRTWYCMWVRDDGRIFDATHRPDRLGVFFTASPPDPQTGQQKLYAHEVRELASDEPKAAKAIDFMRQVASVQIVPFAGEREPDFTPLTVNGIADR
jgi:Fe-S-cluster containining protein